MVTITDMVKEKPKGKIKRINNFINIQLKELEHIVLTLFFVKEIPILRNNYLVHCNYYYF